MKKFYIAKYLVLASLLVTATTLTGCRNEFDFEEARGERFVKDKLEEYDQAFAKVFGSNIDPDHAWGFLDMIPEEITTRGANPNSNQWGDTYNVPAAISSEEAEAVYKYFDSYAPNTVNDNVEYTDYFVQHVWTGNESYTAGNGGTVVGSSQMNHLIINGEHVNNFNTGSGQIMLMEGTPSKNFGYHNSTDSQNHFEYLVLFVPEYGSYYVGFDFYANGQNPNQQVERDYKYTDWIIKLTPATKKSGVSTLNKARIMCEDVLATSGDFDFNDVVFDVCYKTVNGDLQAEVTLQAAGGTLELLIGEGDEAVNIHDKFGVAQNVMVNTKGGATCQPVTFTLYNVTTTNPNDIPVTVRSGSSEYVLEAERGNRTTRKICVPVSVEWADERVPFDYKYPDFDLWLEDQSIRFWLTSDKTETEETTPQLSEEEIALKAAKDNALKVLQALEDRDATVSSEVESAWQTIRSLTSVDAIDSALSNAVAEIEAIIAANTLSAAKVSAVAAIESAVNGDSSENVLAAANGAKTAINAATSVAEVENAKNEGLRAIQSAKDDNNTQQETPVEIDFSQYGVSLDFATSLDKQTQGCNVKAAVAIPSTSSVDGALPISGKVTITIVHQIDKSKNYFQIQNPCLYKAMLQGNEYYSYYHCNAIENGTVTKLSEDYAIVQFEVQANSYSNFDYLVYDYGNATGGVIEIRVN